MLSNINSDIDVLKMMGYQEYVESTDTYSEEKRKADEEFIKDASNTCWKREQRRGGMQSYRYIHIG